MYIYHLISPWVQQNSQFTPLVLELSLIQSHLPRGEFSICALCCSCRQSLQFSFLVPSGTHHCWVNRGGMIWEACPTRLHMFGSLARALVAHPSTYGTQRCLTSVIWWELVTTQPCATITPLWSRVINGDKQWNMTTSVAHGLLFYSVD